MATNEDLQALIGQGRFRRDLCYRLDVLRIDLPPLRARREDIPMLAAHFAARACAQDGMGEKKLEPEAVGELMAQPWLGNVRELAHVLERAVLVSPPGRIRRVDLRLNRAQGAVPAPVVDEPVRGLAGPTREAARGYLTRLLTKHRGKVGPVAREAGVGWRTLYRRLRELGIEPKRFRSLPRAKRGASGSPLGAKPKKGAGSSDSTMR